MKSPVTLKYAALIFITLAPVLYPLSAAAKEHVAEIDVIYRVGPNKIAPLFYRFFDVGTDNTFATKYDLAPGETCSFKDIHFVGQGRYRLEFSNLPQDAGVVDAKPLPTPPFDATISVKIDGDLYYRAEAKSIHIKDWNPTASIQVRREKNILEFLLTD